MKALPAVFSLAAIAATSVSALSSQCNCVLGFDAAAARDMDGCLAKLDGAGATTVTLHSTADNVAVCGVYNFSAITSTSTTAPPSSYVALNYVSPDANVTNAWLVNGTWTVTYAAVAAALRDVLANCASADGFLTAWAPLCGGAAGGDGNMFMSVAGYNYRAHGDIYTAEECASAAAVTKDIACAGGSAGAGAGTATGGATKASTGGATGGACKRRKRL